jgi:hypothetical protein
LKIEMMNCLAFASPRSNSPQSAKRIVAIAGATGIVGREILQGLLTDDLVTTIHALGWHPLNVQHPKLTSHVVLSL